MAGDLFALTLRDGGYLGVRIADDDAVVVGSRGFYVVYVYASVVPELGHLVAVCGSLDGLLLPPLLVGRGPWSRGYLTFVCAGADCPGELLPTHAFEHTLNRRLYDAHDHELQKRPRQYVGNYAIYSPSGLAAEVDKALTRRARR